MIPGLNSLPVEEMVWLKREELMREFQDIRLERAARISNPGVLERFALSISQLLIRKGEQLREQYTLPRQTYLDSSARFAA